MQKIDFYFDYLSPFAYFAFLQLQKMQALYHFELHFHPILLAGLLNHFKHKGPAEIPLKRECVYKQCLRYAKRNQIDFQFTAFHPFNPLPSLRLTCFMPTVDIMTLIWQTGWVKGLDIGDSAVLRDVLITIGLNGDEIMKNITDPKIKNQLKENTERAISKDIFGVPSFILNDDEVFWGNDVLIDLEFCLKGKDYLDKNEFQKIMERGSSATR